MRPRPRHCTLALALTPSRPRPLPHLASSPPPSRAPSLSHLGPRSHTLTLPVWRNGEACGVLLGLQQRCWGTWECVSGGAKLAEKLRHLPACSAARRVEGGAGGGARWAWAREAGACGLRSCEVWGAAGTCRRRWGLRRRGVAWPGDVAAKSKATRFTHDAVMWPPRQRRAQ